MRYCCLVGYADALTMMNRQDLLPSYTSSFQTLLVVNTSAPSTPPQPSYGTCTMTGDPHATTFDGSLYSFYGACVYYAVYDNVRSLKYPRFNIQIETVKCAGDRSCVSGAIINVFPCPTSAAGVKAANDTNGAVTPTVIRMDALHGGVTINGNDVTGNLPELIEDARVIVQSDGHVLTTTCHCDYNHGSFAVRWTGQYNIQVLVGSSVKNQILGLCGKWDGDKSDDFTLIDGTTLPWISNPLNDQTVQRFTESYQLPSHSATCAGPSTPTACKTPYHDTSLYCDVFRRGAMYQCNADSSSVFYVDPTPVSRECYIDVCMEPDDDSKAKRACVYYVKYAMQCRCKGFSKIDLTGYQGCGERNSFILKRL